MVYPKCTVSRTIKLAFPYTKNVILMKFWGDGGVV